MSEARTVTITAENAVLSISGHLANASGTKTLLAQTPAGKRVLGAFVPAPFADANGRNFAKAVVLSKGTYRIGAAGSPGDIFVTDETGKVEAITNISVRIGESGE